MYVNEIVEKIENWKKNNPKENEQLLLDPCNAYKRKLLYSSIPKRFDDLLLDSVPSGDRNKSVRFTLMSKEQVEMENNKQDSVIENEVLSKKGF